MQAQTLNSAGVAMKSPSGPAFSKEAAALLSGAKTRQGNALDGVSHAMMFR